MRYRIYSFVAAITMAAMPLARAIPQPVRTATGLVSGVSG